MTKAKNLKTWKYGDPAFNDWKQLADHLTMVHNAVKKPKSNPLMERIDKLEQLLKEKK